jgi:predicted RNase H-like HicB family nuclease
MLTAYIQAAMRSARYEWLPEDNLYYGEIPGLPGVWATSASQDDLPARLQDVLEGWIALGLALHHPIPAIDGHAISVALAS